VTTQAKPVIIRITSGLGNQLFQYACALGIANRFRRPLGVDTSWFDFFQLHRPHRSFRLQEIGLVHSNQEFLHSIQRFLLGLSLVHNAPARNVLQFIWTIVAGYRFLNEDCPLASRYHVELDNITHKQSLVLNGYWQNARHAAHAIPEIRSKLFSEWPRSTSAKHLCESLIEEPACFLHIRRGDYIRFGLPVLPSAYYERAVAEIETRTGLRRWLVFAEREEDTICVRHFLRNSEFVLLDSDDRDIEELVLMANCRGAVIANSSFSWWGAALGRPGNPVVLPGEWVQIGKPTPEGLVMPGWQTISTSLGNHID
jgi:hypothetical protein